MTLYERLRTRVVLHHAWAKVRSNGLRAASSDQTKHDARRFDENWVNNIERIQDQLRSQKFNFSGEKGITPSKGKGKTGVRPLVLAPIANRVVRRAILDVLQGYGEKANNARHRWDGVSAVRRIMDTPTSIGGIERRGVPHGLALIDNAVQSGRTWFVRSDIQNFFTRIPKPDVNDFIRNAVNDDQFTGLFEQALATNLENAEELEERRVFKYFPDPEIGVAQGSALSALAANIALQHFDTVMNRGEIVCVRYIDDFIMLGPSESEVQASYRRAQAILKKMKMDVYEPSDTEARKSGKVDEGNIYNGTDVLGYRISGRSRQPCASASRRFLAKLDEVVKRGCSEMKAAANQSSSSHVARYHQSMVQLHKIVWGWSQSFRHTTAKQTFESLDRKVDQRIERLALQSNRLAQTGDYKTLRRVKGIHLLADTKDYPLPDVAFAASKQCSAHTLKA